MKTSSSWTKVLLVTIFFCLSYSCAMTQTKGYIFPGKNIHLFLGKTLQVRPKEKSLQVYGIEGFYSTDNFNYPNKAYACCDGKNSKYDSLVNKRFILSEIFPYTTSRQKNKFKLKVSNPITGILYYDYDPEYEFKWNFDLVDEVVLPEDFFCSNITSSTDKFTGEITITTSTVEGITFHKIITKEVAKIYLSINQRGATLNVGKTGLTLLLTNSKKIDKPNEKIDADVNSASSGYMYSAFVELNQADIKLLSENQITDTRLYIYDGTIDNGKLLSEYLKCLMKR